MNGYDLATRVNSVTKAGRDEKLSVAQAENLLLALEDQQLAYDLCVHVYGPPPDAPRETPEEIPPLVPRQTLDITDTDNV
jgi:hypothetical protein